MSNRRRDDTIRAVDLFCGAGGLSWGLALALEQLAERSDEPIEELVELVAVNHWNKAIETHKQNNPHATHYNAKIEELDPREAVSSERVNILVGGPQCTWHSRARGGRPIDEQKRTSPWHVLDWLQKLYVDCFIIENVPEFEAWGPIGADGRPLKSKKGETFEAWINALHALDYNIEWTTLNAADYGDATSRERLFIIGHRKYRPEFPKPTHSENGDVPGTEPWRSAAEIIDWSDAGDSIWGRSRPLVNNTMRRIAEGIRRHGHADLERFADVVADLEKSDVESMQSNAVALEDVTDEIDGRDEPFLVEHSALDSENAALCLPYLLRQQSGGNPPAVDEPVPTIATKGAISKVEPRPFVLPRNGFHRGLHSNATYDPGDRPLHTVTAKNSDGHLVTPYLVPYYSEREGQRPRTHDIDAPMPTITATGSDPYLTRPYLVEYYGNGGEQSIDDPLPTVTTKARFALCVPELYPFGLDIRFRMLQPRELAAAMGFPSDYEFVGNKGDVTEQIGNAVPVNLAKSLCSSLLTSTDPTIQTFSESGTVLTDGGEDE